MLSPEEINDLAYAIADRFEAVNTFYIEKMAEQIKEIGQLSADNVNKLVEMSKMSQNIDEINKMLARQTGLALKDLYKIYEISGMREYADASIFFEGKGIEQIAFKENVDIQNYINAMSRTTANTFVNLANTTSVQQTYKDVIDTAIQAASSGVTDYNSMIKSVLQNAAVQGMRVEYKSGATRRLDSAARMNILDGVRELNNGLRQIQGEQFGADGVEIDAHSLCAKDHLPYQGKQYSIEAFNKIQSNLKRKISTCNCKHGISYIVLGISPPTYSQKELEEMKYNSTEKISVNGHQMTRYEATQYMRRIETAMRYKKDEIIAFDTAGMDTKKSKQDLRNLQASYRQIGKDAGLRLRYDRAYVPGYRGKQVEPKQITISANLNNTVKTVDLKQEIYQKLLNAAKSGKGLQEGDVKDIGDIVLNDLKKSRATEQATYDKIHTKYKQKQKDMLTAKQISRDISDVINKQQPQSILDKYGLQNATYEELWKENKKAFEFYNTLYTELEDMTPELQAAYNSFKRTTTENIKELQDKLKQVKNVGDVSNSTLSSHLNNSKLDISQVMMDAYNCYPTSWINGSISVGNLTLEKVSRGYYSNKNKIIAISGNDYSELITVAIHELGHRFEHTNPIIKDIERQFYDRRTKNDVLEWLGKGYDKNEKTRKDNFINPYIGKDYNGGAFEIVSMGFQYAYTDPALLWKDEDFAKLIYGILFML